MDTLDFADDPELERAAHYLVVQNERTVAGALNRLLAAYLQTIVATEVGNIEQLTLTHHKIAALNEFEAELRGLANRHAARTGTKPA